MSLVDDVLVEQMRRFHCERTGERYEPIADDAEDARARRITSYMNLIDKLVARQVEELRASSFDREDSDINRYFRLLPETPLKEQWRQLKSLQGAERRRAEDFLRLHTVAGSIDVNIMTKVDAERSAGVKVGPEHSDAMSALRGFALSKLHSSIVLSAGLNQKLYNYATQFDDFFPDETGRIKKKIVLKVSDYRSSIVQGKYLAKRGLWISEYRIESGLNCGGHAFPTDGYLMGPILEEFKNRRDELVESLHGMYTAALVGRGRPAPSQPLEMRVTVQGGIGTADEQEMLLNYYELDGTGWATPFLLVPEATNLDEIHLERLIAARTEQDVYLSDASPFGIPFWTLRESESERARRQRIAEGHPGSSCPKGYLRLHNTEFTKLPICTAARAYQKRKLAHLDEEGLTPEQRKLVEEAVLAKSCICHDLAGGATVKHGINPEAKTALCSGPNIVNFNKIASLEEMVDHIYGRLSLITNKERPHMFITELRLYIEYLRKELDKHALGLSARTPKYFTEFRENLLTGVEYYKGLAGQFIEEKRTRFESELTRLREEIEQLPLLNPVA
ncbi:hypothetical protein LLG95_17085 [bacterium]|nr:hypothetical protein [bacterium]